MVYLLGRTAKSMFLDKPWVQILIICIKFLITLIRLHRYPDVNPALEKRGSNGGLFRSMGRVLRSGVAVLMILSMSLMGAAWWGFGANGTAFAQVKYQIRADLDSSTSMLNLNLRLLPVILGVLLAGYMYTAPVMPKLDRKASVASSARMCFLACLVYILMTATLDCEKNGIQGLETGYSQPACGLNCRCDRPWMEFNPVCVPEQMMTYFSPCHAGCATADTVNNVAVYSNCTCAPGGRVIIGSCDDGSCSRLYSIHQLFFAAASVASTLAFIWQTSVVLETIDKRDIAMAVALVSGVVSMFTFIGGYGYYLGISYFTCAYTRDIRCLLQNDHFVPWVGYSSATLAGVAFIITIITCIIIRRQPEPKEDDLDL